MTSNFNFPTLNASLSSNSLSKYLKNSFLLFLILNIGCQYFIISFTPLPIPIFALNLFLR